MKGLAINMTIREIMRVLDAELFCCELGPDVDLKSVCGSDLMSDVLAHVKEQAVLLSGLVNPQVIRTAEMMDMLCVVFVRGKKPTDEIVSLAKEMGICVLATRHTMFMASGLLYQSGMRDWGRDD